MIIKRNKVFFSSFRRNNNNRTGMFSFCFVYFEFSTQFVMQIKSRIIPNEEERNKQKMIKCRTVDLIRFYELLIFLKLLLQIGCDHDWLESYTYQSHINLKMTLYIKIKIVGTNSRCVHKPRVLFRLSMKTSQVFAAQLTLNPTKEKKSNYRTRTMKFFFVLLASKCSVKTSTTRAKRNKMKKKKEHLHRISTTTIRLFSIFIFHLMVSVQW